MVQCTSSGPDRSIRNVASLRYGWPRLSEVFDGNSDCSASPKRRSVAWQRKSKSQCDAHTVRNAKEILYKPPG